MSAEAQRQEKMWYPGGTAEARASGASQKGVEVGGLLDEIREVNWPQIRNGLMLREGVRSSF